MTDGDRTAGTELETQLVSIIRKPSQRRLQRKTDPIAGLADLSSVAAGVGSAPTNETERVIKTPEDTRDLLNHEGDRVQREVTTYADASQRMIASLRLVAEDLTHRIDRPAPNT